MGNLQHVRIHLGSFSRRVSILSLKSAENLVEMAGLVIATAGVMTMGVSTVMREYRMKASGDQQPT